MITAVTSLMLKIRFLFFFVYFDSGKRIVLLSSLRQKHRREQGGY